MPAHRLACSSLRSSLDGLFGILSLAAIGVMLYASGVNVAFAQNATDASASKIQQPAEFKKFTDIFYEDLLDDVSSEEEILNFVPQDFQDEVSRKNLRAYLDDITRDENSDAQLKALWRSSPADIIFYDGEELRRFLRAVRDRLLTSRSDGPSPPA